MIPAWYRYKQESKHTAESKGLYIVPNLQEIMALSHIFLLKPNQHSSRMMEAFGAENLSCFFERTRAQYVDTTLRCTDTLFLEIKSVVEGINDSKISRQTAKARLGKLYDAATPEESALVDVIQNCVSTLPRHQTDGVVGEMELITGYIDPVLRPILHDPDSMRLFRWTNRTGREFKNDDDHHRPDGTMTLREQYHMTYALGFCEAKAEDTKHDKAKQHADLLRLGIFSQIAINRLEVKAVMAIQVIGCSVRVYLMTLAADALYTMVEIAHLSVPTSLDTLHLFLMELTTLMRIRHTYQKHCVKMDSRQTMKTKMARRSLTSAQLDNIVNSGNIQGGCAFLQC